MPKAIVLPQENHLQRKLDYYRKMAADPLWDHASRLIFQQQVEKYEKWIANAEGK